MLNDNSGFDTNEDNGFDTAVLTHNETPNPIVGAGCGDKETANKERYFLISNTSSKPIKPKTVNRKRIDANEFFQYGDEWIWVLSDNYPGRSSDNYLGRLI